MVAGMLMPLHDLRAIYEVLFRDGVMVAKKDKRPQIKHPEVQGVTNLQVIRAMGSLKSRGYVKETFAWRHFYWYLTNEGIVYLRDFLHLPAEIVPASLQRVRKPASTLAIAHRAAKVQSVEGPTSYVPKPGRRGEAESEEAERQGYRHKVMGPRERENYSDRTARFRGRPLAAEPVRPKASWEVEDQPQTMFRKENIFRSEAAVMEESRVTRVSHQQVDMSRERSVTTSQERRGFEVQNEKVSSSIPVQIAAIKQDVSQTTQASVSSKTALPLTVPAVAEATGGTTSKIPAEPSSRKTNQERSKITGEKMSRKSSEMITRKSATTSLPDKEAKEEKTKKLTANQVKAGEVKATAETDKVQSQEVISMVSGPQTTSVFTDTVTASPVNKDVTERKTKKAKMDQIKSAEVKTTVETATDKGKSRAAITMGSVHESSTDTSTIPAVVTKPAKENEIRKARVTEESVTPSDGNVKLPFDSEIDHKKEEKNAKVTFTQETTNPDNTTGTPVKTPNVAEEVSKVNVATIGLVNLSEKPKTAEVPQKTTTVTKSSVLEVTTTVSTKSLTAPVVNAEDAQPATLKTRVTEKKADVKKVDHVNKDGKIAQEAHKDAEQGPTLVQKDTSPSQLTTEVIKETKVAEGSSKSKRKKKKSPGEILKAINAEEPPDTKEEQGKNSKDKEEVSENNLKPRPVTTSKTVTVSTSVKTEEPSPVEKNRAEATKGIKEEQNKEVPKQTGGTPKKEVKKQPTKLPPVPPVELPGDAHLHNNTVEKDKAKKATQGPVCPMGELPHSEELKTEKMTLTKMETVTVQKAEVGPKEESSKNEEKNLRSLPESQKPTVDTKSLLSTGKAAEESSKGKKKGKGKKEAKAQGSETINTRRVILPEAEAFPSTDITPLPTVTVEESPVTASELTEMNVSLKMTPEGMCSEETRQAAAVLSEAPVDKGEVEPALLFAEKIKREVPKPKTSSTAREAPAAGELASAAPAVTAQAAVAQAQTSPLFKQEEPSRVAQHLTVQAAERSTEKRLCVSEALTQEEEKKRDLKEDTPSATATPAASQPDKPHLGDSCESIGSDIDEANMKRKIVVVEEIVEVKQLLGAEATESQSPPQPPTPVEPEAEGEELDLDVLEALAIERALLSGATGVTVQGASPEADWDHSLEDPEEKKWPNFIEGLFESRPIILLPAVPLSLMHVM
ncbi:Plectin [Channa argus]|uniref:Plectin n=1 Tax=Channa argus TaxID=215402 RepID=A0A6G1PMP1_CHAAH|nr:Plectin [Channa argus]